MKDRVVIITGASSGIGKACAEIFGAKGSKIAITGRNLERLEETKAELTKKGINVFAFQADVSKELDNKNMAEAVIKHFGRIDVLINNAGITMRASFEETDMDVIRKVMDINFFGAVYATRYCMQEILKNKGSILGISSIAGYRGLPGRTGYSSSKFALQGFLETLRTEMLHRGVNVLTVCPGYTTSNIRNAGLLKDGSQQGETPRDENKMMSAEECANHIYKATIKRKKILTLTTQGKLVVFLNKFFPVLMDKIVYNSVAKEPNSPFEK
jgi:short-subunit dehydrogenase